MREIRQFASTPPKQSAEVELAAIAARQAGRVGWAQLRQLGLAEATISAWTKRGRLHLRLPGVYAVGHTACTIESDLVEALLYAGPGAALSHTTGCWWRNLLKTQPTVIHVTTPRRVRSPGAIRVHHRKGFERELHRDLPTVTVARLLLDIATLNAPNMLRKVLANAEYSRDIELAEVKAQLKPGRNGSAALRAALQSHLPQLARTKSDLEADFLFLCERHGIPIPEPNRRIGGWEVDMSWAGLPLAIELDGAGNHGTEVFVARDRRKELALRQAGVTVVRYSGDQVYRHEADVAADVRSILAAAEQRAA